MDERKDQVEEEIVNTENFIRYCQEMLDTESACYHMDFPTFPESI